MIYRFKQNQKEARVHFIPDLKDRVFVTLRTPEVIKCAQSTALRYLRELKKAKQVIEQRISNTINLWKLTGKRILLIDVDSKIPNFALMKISTYHKAKGDNVKLVKLKLRRRKDGTLKEAVKIDLSDKPDKVYALSLIHISEPTRLGMIS